MLSLRPLLPCSLFETVSIFALVQQSSHFHRVRSLQ